MVHYLMVDRAIAPFHSGKPSLNQPLTPSQTTRYDKVVECAQKGVSSPDGTLSAELREWASGITAEDIIYEIARGHFTVWVDADRMFPIMTGWWYLKPAFDLVSTSYITFFYTTDAVQVSKPQICR